MTRTILTCFLACGLFMSACAAPQKSEDPVGRPPTEEDKRVPKDPTDEDVDPNSNGRSAITSPRTVTPAR